MALITDPDNLSQGDLTSPTDAAWTASAGAATTITGAATLPALTSGDYFEVRDHSVPGNNGLYLSTGTPTTSSITCTKQATPNPVNATAEAIRTFGKNTTASTQKMVMFDAAGRKITLITKGNLSNDGVTEQCLYSFADEEWKDDADLIAHPFPYTGVTPVQFEIGVDPSGVYNGWTYNNNTPRKLIRSGGWSEFLATGILNQMWTGVKTLGTFEDSVNDLAYYQQGDDPKDTAAAVSFAFAGPVNEAVLTYNLVTFVAGYTSIAITTNNTLTRSAGSWLTDGYKKGGRITIASAEDAGNNGTFTISTTPTATVLVVTGTPLTNNAADTSLTGAVDDRNVLNLFLRVRDADTNGKTFSSSKLSAIGETIVTNGLFPFPLSNITDLKISVTDATITGGSPYTEIKIRYFDQAFSKEVDSQTNRDFGIVIDVGTHSGVDGSYTSGLSVLTSAEGGIPIDATYTGGTLTVHDGTPDGVTYTISGTPTATTVTITTTFPGTDTNVSFTLQRATPVVATAEQIYAKVQYLMRQASDVDSTDQVVTGKTAVVLLGFEGDALKVGKLLPSNPNGGGSGTIIQGFAANDTNRIGFFDNSGVERAYPFVAAGTITFSATIDDDPGPAKYWMFFEYVKRTTVTDLALSLASGDTASIDSAGANLPTVVQNQYINILGATNPNNNGIWIVTDATPTTSQFDARRVSGATVANQTAFSGTIDDNPINSPDAIVVNNNSGSPIQGTVGGATVNFDFDYDNNVQGGRTAATDAVIRVRTMGTSKAQPAGVLSTITRATGLAISVVAGLERNYANT